MFQFKFSIWSLQATCSASPRKMVEREYWPVEQPCTASSQKRFARYARRPSRKRCWITNMPARKAMGHRRVNVGTLRLCFSLDKDSAFTQVSLTVLGYPDFTGLCEQWYAQKTTHVRGGGGAQEQLVKNTKVWVKDVHQAQPCLRSLSLHRYPGSALYWLLFLCYWHVSR